MKRRWNLLLWVGFLILLAALVSYPMFFVWIPATRDLPWINMSIAVAGAILLSAGIARAFRQPQLYRGRIMGPILGIIGLAALGFFAVGIFYLSRQVPASANAPRVGQKAPDFTLPDHTGKSVSLSDLLSGSKPGSNHGAVLIFFRGHW